MFVGRILALKDLFLFCFLLNTLLVLKVIITTGQAHLDKISLFLVNFKSVLSLISSQMLQSTPPLICSTINGLGWRVKDSRENYALVCLLGNKSCLVARSKYAVFFLLGFQCCKLSFLLIAKKKNRGLAQTEFGWVKGSG